MGKGLINIIEENREVTRWPSQKEMKFSNTEILLESTARSSEGPPLNETIAQQGHTMRCIGKSDWETGYKIGQRS